MTCDTPITAYRSQEWNPETGRYALQFSSKGSLSGVPIKVPCGKCDGCKLEKARQWGVRCMHEAQMHEQSCFLTLTYAPEHLPVDYSVHTEVVSDFMKALRHFVYPKLIRFFCGAEYGDKDRRPHYHLIIFGYDFPDKQFWERTERGDIIYTSAKLAKLWGKGFCTLGAATFESVAYTARYSMKKVGGAQAASHYLIQHPNHGFICRVRPEFLQMSRKPGIGATWLAKYKSDVYPHDAVIVNGFPSRPPRFYDQQLSEEEMRKLTIKRMVRSMAAENRPRDYNEYLGRTETRSGKMQSITRKL